MFYINDVVNNFIKKFVFLVFFIYSNIGICNRFKLCNNLARIKIRCFTHKYIYWDNFDTRISELDTSYFTYLVFKVVVFILLIISHNNFHRHYYNWDIIMQYHNITLFFTRRINCWNVIFLCDFVPFAYKYSF